MSSRHPALEKRYWRESSALWRSLLKSCPASLLVILPRHFLACPAMNTVSTSPTPACTMAPIALFTGNWRILPVRSKTMSASLPGVSEPHLASRSYAAMAVLATHAPPLCRRALSFAPAAPQPTDRSATRASRVESSLPFGCRFGALFALNSRWRARQDSNLRPPACEADRFH